MYNDFVIVGPAQNPAGLKMNDSAATVFKKIAEKNSPFASRADDSGTHKKEKQIWVNASFKPSGKWYMETGQGMGETLIIANEKGAYCLTDRGTYIAYKNKINLPILCQGDLVLFNPYGIIAVSPARQPHVKYVYAMALIGWLTSPEGQKIIGDFKKDGEVMFYPSAYSK
jgi:tungstate transport system substrate-binding protein